MYCDKTASDLHRSDWIAGNQPLEDGSLLSGAAWFGESGYLNQTKFM